MTTEYQAMNDIGILVAAIEFAIVAVLLELWLRERARRKRAERDAASNWIMYNDAKRRKS